MGELNIVENWLQSLDLSIYTQPFLDNGYDDLEICKQIGKPDLDAIGVESDEDRCVILDAVKVLKEKGGTHVYFTLKEEHEDKPEVRDPVPVRPTLDNLLSDVPPPSPSPGTERLGHGNNYNDDLGPNVQGNRVTYPKLKLTVILRDKVFADQVDLAAPPYTAPVSIFKVKQKCLICYILSVSSCWTLVPESVE